MPIKSVVINSQDIARSVAFYTTYFEAQVISQTDDCAVLDLVTIPFEIVKVGADAPASNWKADDQQLGFSHFGFKVGSVDSISDALRAVGTVFHLEPLDAFGGVRIAFFRDPDGTMLELVEGNLTYSKVVDTEAVDAEPGRGTPTRPRFDHIATSVADFDAAAARWAPLGFTLVGELINPEDPKGFEIRYLRSGDTDIEVFTFAKVPTYGRDGQVGAPGFAELVLDTSAPEGSVAIGTGSSGHQVVSEPDGLFIAG